MYPNEKIKQIEGFENYYISNFGRVFSTARGDLSVKKNKIHTSKGGTKKVYARLRKEGKEILKAVDKLVAKYFLDNPNNCKLVKHKDGDPTNNKANNLEWIQRPKIKDNEKLKKIEGTKHYYVSNLGRVFSDYYGQLKEKSLVNLTGGYKGVNLHYKDGAKKCERVHILVAEHFIDNPDNLETVDHIDGDITNNKASNLQWMTRGANSVKQHKENGTHQLTPEEVRWIRENLKKGDSKYGLRPLAKKFGFKSPQSIKNIFQGISYKWVE